MTTTPVTFVIYTANSIRAACAAVQAVEPDLDDPQFEVVIREHKKSRSLAQNSALFGIAYPPLMDYMGMRGDSDKEDLHAYFCGEYFGWVDYTILGKRKQRPRRTTTRDEDGKRNLLDTVAMADFYSFVQQRGAENGVDVPDPKPVEEDK